ncbi:MAG: hypothetical protein Q4E05_11790, partial [Pseudoclavibacter sp.]|nr:hypothetical protein [Pseudoclavibacter sp.]
MRNDGEHGEVLGRWRASLTAAGLVGAERRSVPAPPPALGAVEPSGRDAAERLLEHAALLDVAVRAGTEPMRLSEEHGVPLAPAERLPEAGAAAAAVLERLLERTMDLPAEVHGELLGEWCLLASARGVRIPARLL